MDMKTLTPAETLKRSTNYSATETAEVRTGLITKAINAQLDIMTKAPVKTDLHDLTAVRAVAEHYVRRCAEAAILPNFEGLAASLGISRKWAYEFCRKHESDPSTEFLNNLRLSFASLRIALSEAKVIDNATAIFVLKNSDLGFVDKVELTPPEPTSPYTALSEEALKQKYLMDMVSDDE